MNGNWVHGFETDTNTNPTSSKGPSGWGWAKASPSFSKLLVCVTDLEHFCWAPFSPGSFLSWLFISWQQRPWITLLFVFFVEKVQDLSQRAWLGILILIRWREKLLHTLSSSSQEKAVLIWLCQTADLRATVLVAYMWKAQFTGESLCVRVCVHTCMCVCIPITSSS